MPLDAQLYSSTAQAESAQAQFSTSDYGAVGDQRPYQIVYPAYGAPKFLQTFMDYRHALRECDTLCRLTGRPFRLVRWGARVPCMPCRGRIRDNVPPGLKVVYSPGALKGFPEAQPVADVGPEGMRIVYAADGSAKLTGKPNFFISRSPVPRRELIGNRPETQDYFTAVRSAVELAQRNTKPVFVCSSFGANCGGSNQKAVPVVYVQPGGFAKRYDDAGLGYFAGPSSNEVQVTPVSADWYRELIAESRGATRLGQGA